MRRVSRTRDRRPTLTDLRSFPRRNHSLLRVLLDRSHGRSRLHEVERGPHEGKLEPTPSRTESLLTRCRQLFGIESAAGRRSRARREVREEKAASDEDLSKKEKAAGSAADHSTPVPAYELE